MRPGAPLVVDRAWRDDRAERKPAAERLREKKDVGLHFHLLRREPRAGASEAGLDLVDDEQRADARRDLADVPHERRGSGDVAALTQHGLDEDRGHVLRRDLVLEDRLALAD